MTFPLFTAAATVEAVKLVPVGCADVAFTPTLISPESDLIASCTLYLLLEIPLAIWFIMERKAAKPLLYAKSIETIL